MTHKFRDLLDVAIIYLVTAGAGWWVAHSLPGHPMLRAAAADLAMTVLVFACSVWKSNSSTYDAYWSVIPFLLVMWLFALTDGLGWHSSQWAAMLVVVLWSWRLTLNWARGWPGWHHEDWRYVDLQEKSGRLKKMQGMAASADWQRTF